MASETGPRKAFEGFVYSLCARRRFRAPTRWRKWTVWVVLVLGLVLRTVNAAGADANDFVSSTFEAANRLYEQGKYGDAISSYLKILAAGIESPAIYFNLGNAYFKSGQAGRAIYYYRKAARLAPRDPDIRANLKFARATVSGGKPVPEPIWKRAVTVLRLDEWAILWTCGLWLFCIVQAIRQVNHSIFHHKRLPTAVLLIVLVACGAGLGCAWHLDTQQWAIVVRPDTVLHHGPLEESPSLQTLPDGQELEVVDRKDEWLQVAGAARGTGWIHTNDVVLLP
ncbi:MAG: tetratricopeptide repeat protein [Verrucomicrobiae bacterium]|nr:tetratricopeptide repeat protein [Verrucomicrobiae bacterium]